MTSPTQGEHAQTAPQVQRYKIGYPTDSWGERSSTPGGIPDFAGTWVRYADHAAVITALRAQQPAPAGATQEPTAFIHWPINGPPRLVWYSQKALNDAILKTYAGHQPDVKLYTAQPAPATQQAGEVRPVTPYTCPKCHALWLHWPAEQTGFGRDTLNCRSADHCHYCEKAGVEQLQRLERIPAALHAPQPTPAAQADSVLEDAAASEVLMEHSGCGSGTQVDMLTVRLNPGDKVIMLKGRITQAIDAARKQGGA